MQRNEMDAVLMSAEPIGLGTPELWQRLSLELDGKTTLEKPRVSKKVLVKAIRMQTEAMRFLVDEFDRLQHKMDDMERDAKNSQKQVERVNSKVITLSGQFEEMTIKVDELETRQQQQDEQLKRIDDVAAQVRVNHDEICDAQQQVVLCNANHSSFVDKVEQDLLLLKQDQEVTKQFALQLEDRMNAEEKELFLNSDHILHNQLSLAMWMEQTDKESRRKDEAIREFADKMNKQAKNVQEMMLESRRTLDDNTCAVEDVQRLLLLKADRTKVDEIIEAKYEEICNQLDKALASVIGEEDEFKRVSQELQQLVTHLSESKADKKELLEVKEQVLYDSRVRQQVENLRAFIDLKMNRDDVFSALKNKADKDEMVALLKSLSESMNASVQQAQRSFTEAESAFLTSKHVAVAGGGGGAAPLSRRGNVLPSLDKERCLSCNSVIRDSPHGAHSNSNKTPQPIAPVFGGGFQVASMGPALLNGPKQSNNNHLDSLTRSNSLGGSGGARTGVGGLNESSSEGWAIVISIRGGDLEGANKTVVFLLSLGFCWVPTATYTREIRHCWLRFSKNEHRRKLRLL
jgi:hypothetical protein